MDVWSDGRGPFVLVSSASQGTTIFTGGTGHWAPYYSTGEAGQGLFLSGFSGGDVLLFGAVRCGIVSIGPGGGRCAAGLGALSGDLIVVGSDRAFAVDNDRVLAFDGSKWTQYLSPLATLTGDTPHGSSIWADTHTVAVTAFGGNVLASRDGAAFMEDTPVPLDRYRAIWGVGSELWVGGRNGDLFSRSALKWSKRARVVDQCGSGIYGLWGTGATLYANTQHSLVRWNSATTEVVAELPCTQIIRGMWGESPGTVYLAVEDTTAQSSPCGSARLLVVRDGSVHSL